VTAWVKSSVTLPLVTRTSLRCGTIHGPLRCTVALCSRCAPRPSASPQARPPAIPVRPAGPKPAPRAHRRCVPSRQHPPARRVPERSHRTHRTAYRAGPSEHPFLRVALQWSGAAEDGS
jgi:hypothetical protein